MNNIIANIRTQVQKLKCRIANLSNRVTYIEDNCCNGGSGDGIQSIVAGDNISVDNTDPQNPIVSSTGELQDLQSVLSEGNSITLPAREGDIHGIYINVTPESFEESESEWFFPYALVSEGGAKGGQFTIQVNNDGYIGIATSIGTIDDNTHVSNNLYYGGFALNSLTRAAVSNGSNYNTAVGSQSLRYLIDGSRNTAIGSYAGRGIATGSRNITVGSHALYDSREGFTTTASTIVGNVRGINENLVNSIVLSDGRDVSGTSGVGFWVKQNGLTLIPRQTITTIDNDTTGKAVITKEYFDANSGGGELVQITEGLNTGWGLKYRADNPNRYGDIGNNAIDLSISNSSSSTRGATGSYSTVSGGQNNTSTSNYSTVSGGYNNTASGVESATVSGGASNTASEFGSTVSGGGFNTASGTYSTVSGGYVNTANSYGEWVGGIYGTIPSGQSAITFVATDRLFNIGNGTSTSARSNAFTILKNGLATLPSVTNTLIDAEPTGKAVVTKEWVQANSGGTTPTLAEVLAEGNNAGDEVIQFEWDVGLSTATGSVGVIEVPSGGGFSNKFLGIGNPNDFVYNGGFRGSVLSFQYMVSSIIGEPDLYSYHIEVNPEFESRGLVGSSYFGANYDDNTYVQKKYVDDAIDAIPTPSLTLEQARQNGNVFEGDVHFSNGDIGKAITFSNSQSSKNSSIFNEDGHFGFWSFNIDGSKDIMFTLIANDDKINISSTGNLDFKGIVGSHEFDKQGDRKAFAQIADVEDFYTTITGYDAGETQTLKHVNGVLQWVTD